MRWDEEILRCTSVGTYYDTNEVIAIIHNEHPEESLDTVRRGVGRMLISLAKWGYFVRCTTPERGKSTLWRRVN